MSDRCLTEHGGPRLMLGIEDFGPIVRGDLQLRPLTVLIGPNNSGKSYASALVRALFAERPQGVPYGVSRWLRMNRMFADGFDLADVADRVRVSLADFVASVRRARPGECLGVPPGLMEPIWQSVGQWVYGERLQGVLERYFGCRLRELIRFGQFKFALSLGFDDSLVEVDTHYKKALRATQLPPPPRDVHLAIREGGVLSGFPPRVEGAKIELSVPRGDLPYELELAADTIFSGVLSVAFSMIAPTLTCEAHYLPAARSGILQGHRALAASMVEAAPLVGLRPVEVPRLSGLASDFIATVLRLPPEEGPYYEIASRFETRIIDGRIVAPSDDDGSYPELYYEFRGQQIPLRRSSSTVSELAPVFLYLKHVVARGDLLIIEEPEAHLHPENQRLLAGLLVDLVNNGLNLLLTTHSEFLLAELNNRVMVRQAQPRLLAGDAIYSERDGLDPSALGVFAFRRDARTDGWRVEELPVDQTRGVSEDEFLRVHELLYEDTVTLMAGIEDGDRDE